ncbi:MAG TPA: winged helix-turn-helix domain-containing protein [Chitinophagaceae bacterium]|nr:winged helix-turn-helix domain-containing protein [Chitinophagaceae bacterium]
MKYRFLFVFPVAAVIIILTVYASDKDTSTGSNEAGYNAALRLIGHKLLLSAGDSRSRVLPVKKLSGKEFEIHFEHPVSLEPDSVFNIIHNTTKSSLLPDEYAVDVIQCSDDQVAYSFVNSRVDSNTIVPCLGRTLPERCYYVSISFALAGPPVSEPGYIFMGAFVGLMLASFVFYFYVKKKKSIPASLEVGIATSRSATRLGNYLFVYDQRYLEINKERIDLTDKESKLLHILSSSPNKTIDRERFQKEVWENEGVIVTRSLDVFISRLRKKLEKDSSIRLINVHGKGYKLEVPA